MKKQSVFNNSFFISGLLLLVYLVEYISNRFLFVYSINSKPTNLNISFLPWENIVNPNTSICCNPFYPYFIAGWILLIIIFSIGYAKKEFDISGFTASRFLSNALGLRPLNLIFAFVFTMHLSWLCDESFELMFQNNNPLLYSLIRIGIILVGLLYIFFIFPDSKVTDKYIPEEKRTVLISGLSNISIFNMEGKFAPNFETFILPFSKFKNIRKILIITSSSPLKSLDIMVKNIDKLPNDCLKKYYREYVEKVESEKNSKEVTENIKHALEELIKKSIKLYYDDIDISKLEFIFTDPVSYDNMELINNALLSKLTTIKEPDEEILINISPGTSVIGGVLSISAIKGDRLLVYTKQNTDSQENELLIYNPNVLTFKKLIQKIVSEL